MTDKLTSRIGNSSTTEAKDISYHTIPIFAILSGKIKVDYSCGKCGTLQRGYISSREDSVLNCRYCDSGNRFILPHLDMTE